VHGYGYAFEAQGAAASGARLVWGAMEVPLYEGENVLGRDPGPRGAIPDASVSRRHARLTLAGDTVTLEDLGSKNGTFAGDRRIDGPTPLVDGDAIRLGLVTLVFRAANAGASTKTAVQE
jgi:pSer/pThr/pTyr-binding forkhead associated (FHA) protein